MTIAQGQTEFQARLKRIERKGAGRVEVFNAEFGLKDEMRFCERPHGSSGLMKLPVAFLVGAVSLVSAKLAIFKYGGLPPEFAQPDFELMVQLGLAFVLMVVAAMFFNLMGKTQLMASALGIVLAVTAMHNLVHIAPNEWGLLFSPQWVNEIRATTEPNTLEFRGARYRLG